MVMLTMPIRIFDFLLDCILRGGGEDEHDDGDHHREHDAGADDNDSGSRLAVD